MVVFPHSSRSKAHPSLASTSCRAEVLSADAFGAFEDAGLADDAAVAATGRRFAETVLALGGGRAPADVFADFRGRAPSVEPLLRHSGLLPAAATA